MKIIIRTSNPAFQGMWPSGKSKEAFEVKRVLDRLGERILHEGVPRDKSWVLTDADDKPCGEVKP